jgi:hypothetical protein
MRDQRLPICGDLRRLRPADVLNAAPTALDAFPRADEGIDEERADPATDMAQASSGLDDEGLR